MDDRTYLLGCILQGMATRKKPYFGMVEDALAVADAAVQQLKDESNHSHSPEPRPVSVKGFWQET